MVVLCRICLIAIIVAQLSSEGICRMVCYEPFDCFTDDPPFASTATRRAFLPLRRDVINVTYYLFERQEVPNQRNTEFLTVNVTGPYTQSHKGNFTAPWRQQLIASKPMKVIIHDYGDTARNAWVYAMVEKFLAAEDSHVIAVHWNSPGGRNGYHQAIANGRLVGAEVALLLGNIKEVNPSVDFGSIHLIGHGIGAHIASYVGHSFKAVDDACTARLQKSDSWWDVSSWWSSESERECPKLPRIGHITGLDPSGLWYENADMDARLDSSDAIFVDVIHTDVTERTLSYRGSGISIESGHIDFYPNGGFKQPGCESQATGLEQFRYTQSTGSLRRMNCNHLRSITYYLSSIDTDSCTMTSYPCGGWFDFIDGKCTSCTGVEKESDGYSISGLLSYVGISQETSTRQCLQLGPSARKFWREHREMTEADGLTPRNLKAYMKTKRSSPYCVKCVRVEMELAEPSSEGVLSIRFTNQEGVQTELIKAGRVSNWDSTANPSYLVTLPNGFENVTGVSVLWEVGVTTSWWPGLKGSGRKARNEELRLPVTKIRISEPPSDKITNLCSSRQRLRPRKETWFTHCYSK